MNTKWLRIVLVSLTCVLASCTSTSENNVDFTYVLSASPDINPDIEGKPSSVLVRVFQLSNDINFRNASYDQLMGSHDNALGTEFIAVTEYLVDPDSRREVELKISEHTKFIGVAVGYRSMDMVTWRTVVSMPEANVWTGWSGLSNTGLEIKVQKLSVRVIEI